MTLKSRDIEIFEDKPFENCKLDREQYAEVLTAIVQNYDDGFVLAVDNKWGEGKTTFIKMWKRYLELQKFKTIYFNAWEHDFGNDALTAILSELKSLDLGRSDKSKELIRKGVKVGKNLIPILVSALANKYIDIKEIKESINAINDGLIDIFEEEINDYASKKAGLEEFRTELSKFLKDLKQRPLIFFVDELDRCNPKYAVEVLEIIKHFFSVDGIVFILSIDKEQLCHSINGYYGSDNIDSNEYLRRFIDIEYSIPSPSVDDYCNILFFKYGFNKLYSGNFSPTNETIVSTISETLSIHKPSLRVLEKFFIHLKLVSSSINLNYDQIDLLLIINYLRFFHKNTFDKIVAAKITYEELLVILLKDLDHLVNKKRNQKTIHSISCILYAYITQEGWDIPSEHMETNPDKLILDYSKSDKFEHINENILRLDRGEGRKINISKLISKIESLENMQF
jgi:uncharacterized protein YeeX (DUF496 family)